MLNIFLSFALVFVCVVRADVVMETDFEAVDEDRAIYDLKSGNLSSDEDPTFALFVKNTDDCLLLPQTYAEAVLDFVRIITNDYKWLDSLKFRRAIKGLCRKITNSCKINSPHIQDFYTMMVYLAEKFPINERHRLLFFMNKLNDLQKKQADSLEAAQQKVELDALNEEEKQKKEQEKLKAKQDAEVARAEAAQQRAARTPPSRTPRQTKSAAAKDPVDVSAPTLSGEQKGITPAKSRGGSRKAATNDAQVPVAVAQEQAPVEPAVRDDRFVLMHEVTVLEPAVQESARGSDEQAATAP